MSPKILCVLCAFSFPVAAWAAPAKPSASAKTPVKKIDVDPKARALFIRAAKLYESLDGLHLEWKTTKFDADRGGIIPLFTAALNYDKAGRLRLEDPDNVEILIVNDGVTRSAVTDFDHDSQGNPIVRYTSGKIGKDYYALPSISQDLPFPFSLWLYGEDGLDDERLEMDVDTPGRSEFRVVYCRPRL